MIKITKFSIVVFVDAVIVEVPAIENDMCVQILLAYIIIISFRLSF